MNEFWYFDTGALLSLASDATLLAAVQDVVKESNRIALLTNPVEKELDYQSIRSDEPVRSQAKLALAAAPRWLRRAPTSVLESVAFLDVARQFQLELAGLRPLQHEYQHWAESCILAYIDSSTRPDIVHVVVSDDYSARVAVNRIGGTPMSTVLLVHKMLKSERITTADAERFAKQLHNGQRTSHEYSVQDLISGDLGRIGQP